MPVNRRVFLKRVAQSTCGLALASLTPWSSVGEAETTAQTVRYLWVDQLGNTALLYDENFNALSKFGGSARIGAEVFSSGPDRWLLGLDVDMIRRINDGRADIVNGNPAYTEMNHHIVMGYSGNKKDFGNSCGISLGQVQFPIAAGSELTGWQLPKPYAYRMQGGTLFSATWHWVNPAGVRNLNESVYLRFTRHEDLADSGYIDTDTVALNAAACGATFCVPPGPSTKDTIPFKFDQPVRLVMVYPHVHDHTEKIELLINGQAVTAWQPGNKEVPVAHDACESTGVPWHQTAGHLPPGGIVPWTPGADGPVLKPGDILAARAHFNNPHEMAIDEMLLVPAFFETLKAS